MKPALTFPVIAALVLLSLPARPCTAFCLQDGDHHILAKNLDWPIAEGLIFVNKRGIVKAAFGAPSGKLAWTARYGSVTFNQFGKEFPLGGMNERGLVIEELNSWGDPPREPDLPTLNEFQWVQYLLDNFTSIEEILHARPLPVIDPLLGNLHYLLADRSGAVAIVEFFDGQTHVYHGEAVTWPVLSNDHYQNSLKYLQNFQGFGGTMPVPMVRTTNERFVRAASLLNTLDSFAEGAMVPAAFLVLDAVKQPDTQWSIVYDLTDLTIHFRTAQNPANRVISLPAFDFSCDSPILVQDILAGRDDDIHAGFSAFRPQLNIAFMENVFKKYDVYEPGGLNEAVFLSLAAFGNSIRCRD